MKRQRYAVALAMVLLLAALIPATYHMGKLVLLRLPGQPAMDLLLEGELLSAEGFERIRSSREAALAFAGESQDFIELGLAETFESLMREDISEERASELRQSGIAHLEAGLGRTPVSYSGWYALALARFVEEDIAGAAKAFEGTMLLTPYAAHNLSSRLRLGMALWPDLSEAAQEQLKREIIFAGRYKPFDLALLTLQTNLEQQVRGLLATAEDGPKLLERFGLVQLRLMREASRQG